MVVKGTKTLIVWLFEKPFIWKDSDFKNQRDNLRLEKYYHVIS